MHLLLVFIVFFATSNLSQAERVAHYKEYKILESAVKIDRPPDSADIEYYLKTMERFEKLQEEAIEIRDLYKEMVETLFGLKLTTTSTRKPDILGAPSARKAAEDWVRTSLDLDSLNRQTSDQHED